MLQSTSYKKNNGYKLLAIATLDGGIVIELGDTELNEKEMMKYFSIEEDVGDKHYIIRVWKKN